MPTFDRPNRLKGREEGVIRWGELLEKFRSVQERARRLQRVGGGDLDDVTGDLRMGDGVVDSRGGPGLDGGRAGPGGVPGRGTGPPVPAKDQPSAKEPAAKTRSGLGKQLHRLGARGKRAQ